MQAPCGRHVHFYTYARRDSHRLRRYRLSYQLSAIRCVTTVPVDTGEDGKTLPSLRVSFDVSGDKAPPSHPHTGQAIEIEAMKTKGNGAQFINKQEAVYLNNVYMVGPQSLSDSFYLHYASVSWRWREFDEDSPLGTDISLGAGRASLGLGVTSPLQNASDRFVNYGVAGSVGALLRLSPRASLGAHFSQFISNTPDGINGITRYDTFLALAWGTTRRCEPAIPNGS